jgi:hypothetical protein
VARAPQDKESLIEISHSTFVATGLDPVVHADVRRRMDCRIKSGNDANDEYGHPNCPLTRSH